MRLLILVAVVAGVAWARPETYRENEDFQYSKSSTDEGTKSGYYGAQRGNVGGNYERAHNMDSHAQKQMSTAIKQVEGELGHMQDANVGSVFTAANTHQAYGHQGYHDLNNLQGRNFQESDSFGHSGMNSQSSMLSAGHNAGYEHNSRYTQRSEAAKGGYNNEYARQSAYNQAALDSQFGYDQSRSSKFSSEHKEHYNSQTQDRLVNGGAPVRIVLRPAHTITVPVAAELYDNSHSARFDQNSINSDAEMLSTSRLHNTYRPATNTNKNYESSYSYRKEWEKHHEKPVVTVPVQSELVEDAAESHHSYRKEWEQHHQKPVVTVPVQSELVEDAAESHHSYRKGYQAASEGLSRHNSAYNSQQQHYESAADSANSYSNTALGDSLANTFTGVNSGVKTPAKAYQTSYSYRKSWERQGDPYVIEPASERLTSQSASQNDFQSHQYGSHASQSNYRHADDCEEDHHHRVVRSYNSYKHENNNEQLQQQQQQAWHGEENQRGHLEDWTQQTNNGWESSADLTQQSQNQWGNREDFGQLNQREYGNLEDLSQQVQGPWDGNYNKHNTSNQQWPISNQKPTNDQQPNPLHSTMFFYNQNNEQEKELMTNLFEQPTFSQERVNLGQRNEDFGQEILGQETLPFSGKMATSESQRQNKVQPLLSSSTDNQLAQIELALKQQHVHEVKPSWKQSEETQHSFNDWDYGTHNQMFTSVNEGVTSHRPDSMQNLWDKIDNLAQQSSVTYGKDNKDEFMQSTGSNSYNFQHSYQSWQQSINNNFTNTVQQTTSSTTVTPIINTYPHVPRGDKNFGRGDIGQEDSTLVSRTTEQNSISTSNRPYIALPESGQRYKTHQEIESLSLAEKDTNKMKQNSDSHHQEIESLSLAEKDTNKMKQNSDSQNTSDGDSMGVISLEQERLKAQGRGYADQHKYVGTSTEHAPKYLTHGEFQHVISHEQSKNGYGVYSNEQITAQDYGQQNLEQQSQTNWGEQFNQNQHNGDLTQKTEDLSQKSDSKWDSSGTQIQNKNLQHSDNTQQSQVHSFGNQQETTNNFYEERKQLQQYSKQDSSHQNIMSTPLTVGAHLQETTTVKPGFWKSAKDKVSSWFRRS